MLSITVERNRKRVGSIPALQAVNSEQISSLLPASTSDQNSRSIIAISPHLDKRIARMELLEGGEPEE